MIFARCAKQLVAAKRAFPPTYHPGARPLWGAGHTQDKDRKTYQGRNPHHEPEPSMTEEVGEGFERLVEQYHDSPLWQNRRGTRHCRPTAMSDTSRASPCPHTCETALSYCSGANIASLEFFSQSVRPTARASARTCWAVLTMATSTIAPWYVTAAVPWRSASAMAVKSPR